MQENFRKLIFSRDENLHQKMCGRFKIGTFWVEIPLAIMGVSKVCVWSMGSLTATLYTYFALLTSQLWWSLGPEQRSHLLLNLSIVDFQCKHLCIFLALSLFDRSRWIEGTKLTVDIFVSYTFVSYTRFSKKLMKWRRVSYRILHDIKCHTCSDTKCHTIFFSDHTH